MPAGRPSKYDESLNEKAFKLALLGATDAQMADFFGVTEQTINNWKNDFPKFFESIKEGKDEANSKVAASLYQRALGYSHPDVHISNYQGQITTTPVTKHYPPDTTAAIFWLKNRQKAQWRDQQIVEHTGTVSIQKLGDNELESIAAGSGNRTTGEAESTPQVH